MMNREVWQAFDGLICAFERKLLRENDPAGFVMLQIRRWRAGEIDMDPISMRAIVDGLPSRIDLSCGDGFLEVEVNGRAGLVLAPVPLPTVRDLRWASWPGTMWIRGLILALMRPLRRTRLPTARWIDRRRDGSAERPASGIRDLGPALLSTWTPRTKR